MKLGTADHPEGVAGIGGGCSGRFRRRKPGKDDAGGGVFAHPGYFLQGGDGVVVAFLHMVVDDVGVGKFTDVVGGHPLHHPHDKGVAVGTGGAEDGVHIVEYPSVVLLLGEGGGFTALVGGLEVAAHLRNGGKDGLFDNGAVAFGNLVHPVPVQYGLHFIGADKQVACRRRGCSFLFRCFGLLFGVIVFLFCDVCFRFLDRVFNFFCHNAVFKG